MVRRLVRNALKVAGMKQLWTWNGKRLASPLTMARRLIALSLMPVARLLLCLVTVIGYGIEEARDTWDKTQ